MNSTTTQSLSLSDFDYKLPPDRIARYPLPQRDQSKMLVLNRAENTCEHKHFTDLISFLNPGDLVVFNNAKVMPARLCGHRKGHTGHVEIFLMHPTNEQRTQWQVLMKPARKLKPGTIVQFAQSKLEVTIEEQHDAGRGLVQLSWPSDIPLDDLLEQTGHLPIPPYLQRDTETLDTERYQTVFAKTPGAQAAPTAGLHFTQNTIDQLHQHGIETAELTLYVSAGTFRPINTSISDHHMDPEYYTLPQDTVDKILTAKANGNRVLAIGTTVAKSLESAIHSHQGTLKATSDWSDLFITPGFSFQVVDAMLTNFHLPQSTLLLLVSAFANRDQILNAYQQAIAHNYRFYSYGDCMLIQ